MTIPTNEQETVIRIGRNDAEAIISTTDTLMMHKLDKLADNPDSPWKFKGLEAFADGDIAEKHYTCPKKLISFRSRKTTRTLTEEQKREMSERLRKARE